MNCALAWCPTGNISWQIYSVLGGPLGKAATVLKRYVAHITYTKTACKL